MHLTSGGGSIGDSAGDSGVVFALPQLKLDRILDPALTRAEVRGLEVLPHWLVELHIKAGHPHGEHEDPIVVVSGHTACETLNYRGHFASARVAGDFVSTQKTRKKMHT
jgi:hypothetical protein